MARNVVDYYHIDMTGAEDNAPKLALMAQDISDNWTNRKPQPRFVFPEGICQFSDWPNMAYHNVEIVSEGETVLKYTGTDDAVTFMGEQRGELATLGKRNVVFDGFTIDPGHQSRHGLVITSCHAGSFRAKVLGAGDPRDGVRNSAIFMRYCVVTQLFPTVSNLDPAIESRGGSLDCIGVSLDNVAGADPLPASAVQIMMPILEGIHTGIHSIASFFCVVRDGTIEYCKRGVQMDGGAYSTFHNVEMEGNAEYDFHFTQHAHDNVVWLCGNGHQMDLRVIDDSLTTGNQVVRIGPPPVITSWGR